MGSSARITDIGKKGDLEVHFMWVEDDGDRVPAMYIRNARRLTERGKGAGICIRLNDAWRFDDDSFLVMKAAQYAEVLYGFVTKQDVYRIADAITEWLADLVNMPPPPGLSRDEFMKMVDAHGVDLKADGRSVL